MDDIWTLLVLSLAMLIGCYLSGIIPLSINMSEDKIKLMTVLGAGLLVGTALAVIIPEGIHAMEIGTSDAESALSTPGQQHRHKITATLGLVVHAAADGIALGAAVSMSTAHLTLIVFVAIMLHKMPAAFGLVSFLLHEGFDRPRIRKHLFIFAAAAPIGAIVTYMCLNQKSLASLNGTHTTGIAMLFSAGTFLYVATVHVLPEIASRLTKQTLKDGSVVIHEHKGFTKVDIVALVTGAFIPVILSLGHRH